MSFYSCTFCPALSSPFPCEFFFLFRFQSTEQPSCICWAATLAVLKPPLIRNPVNLTLSWSPSLLLICIIKRPHQSRLRKRKHESGTLHVCSVDGAFWNSRRSSIYSIDELIQKILSLSFGTIWILWLNKCSRPPNHFFNITKMSNVKLWKSQWKLADHKAKVDLMTKHKEATETLIWLHYKPSKCPIFCEAFF